MELRFQFGLGRVRFDDCCIEQLQVVGNSRSLLRRLSNDDRKRGEGGKGEELVQRKEERESGEKWMRVREREGVGRRGRKSKRRTMWPQVRVKGRKRRTTERERYPGTAVWLVRAKIAEAEGETSPP